MYVCIGVLLVSVGYIVYNQYTIFQEKQLLAEVQETKSEAIVDSSENEKSEEAMYESEEIPFQESESNEETTEVIKEKSILPEYEELYKENNDLYGWITIEDTVINYPVMQTPNSENLNFYINRNWDKEETRYGSIYVDGRCDDETENLLIYGHNTIDGSMFGSLIDYKEKEYYEQHKYIIFDTIYEKGLYEIIAVAKGIVYYENRPDDKYLFYEHIELNSEEEFNEYMNYLKDNSWYEINNNAVYGDQIITLCTCDYWTENARLLVVAKRIE